MWWERPKKTPPVSVLEQRLAEHAERLQRATIELHERVTVLRKEIERV